jgi:hypothetical protein
MWAYWIGLTILGKLGSPDKKKEKKSIFEVANDITFSCKLGMWYRPINSPVNPGNPY